MNFIWKISHKEHEVREEHKEESGGVVRYLIVKFRAQIAYNNPLILLLFVIFVPLYLCVFV